MEDFLKFLLIAGVILVGIFKEVNKNSKSKKAKNKRPVSPMPSPVEVAPDAVPMPEAWGGPKSLEELFQPKPLKQTPPQQSPKQTAKPAAQQKRKKEEKTWFNYLFDSCCACCSWRAGSILPVYEETAVAGYCAYTDDGDGKTGCKRYGCRISGNSERGY